MDSDFSLTEEDGEYHLVVAGTEEAADVAGGEEFGLEVDFRMTFTFPGEIIESSGGEVDGTYTFDVRAVDAALNEGDWASGTYTLDRQAPVRTVSTSHPPPDRGRIRVTVVIGCTTAPALRIP